MVLHKSLPAAGPRIDRLLHRKGTTSGAPHGPCGSCRSCAARIRVWADWDKQALGREGGDPRGEFAQTLTVTDVFTGWTETKAVCNKAQKWVFAALDDLRAAFPFPVLGID